MKTLLSIILLAISNISLAGQVSIVESSLVNEDIFFYSQQDNSLQVDFGDKEYLFLGYRHLYASPYYGGIRFDMFGIGAGKKHKVGPFVVFGQAGFYYIENNIGFTTERQEYLDYRFRARFDGPNRSIYAYEVRNGNAFAFAFGADYPITDNFGLKLSYQHMKMEVNYILHFSMEETEQGTYWHDPSNQDISTINAGFYYNF